MAGVALLIAQAGKITAKDQKAAEAITAAIMALGGEKNIDNIKSLILTGTTKYSSHGAVDETEIRILLPDNYLRIDKRIGYGTLQYARASSGESLNIGFTETGGPLGVPRANEVNRFASLLIGALLKGDPVAPLIISAVADTSNKFSIAKETGVLGEIEFDPVRKYPLLISYKDAVRNLTIYKTTYNDGKITSERGGSGNEEFVDSIMRFKDRIAVDGVMFPGTIVFESRGKPISELKFENIQINPKLSLADFEIPNFPSR